MHTHISAVFMVGDAPNHTASKPFLELTKSENRYEQTRDQGQFRKKCKLNF